MKFSRLYVAGFMVTLMACSVSAGAQAAPWRLGEALGSPDWLTIGGTYRLRYETLDNPYRAGATGSDEILVERLLLAAEAHTGNYYFGAELEDSRSQLDDAGTPLGTDDVNTLELLRAYAGYKAGDVFAAGDTFDIQAGRITMDVGSRRLVARNRFRNTINAFTGVNALWTDGRDMRLQAFVTLPVNREPGERARLDNNHPEFDNESFQTTFWGLHLTRDHLIGAASGEAYVFGLHEDDQATVATRNRQIITSGLRLVAKPKAGQWDYELEGAIQEGTSRASTAATDVTDLDHSASFLHASVARTFDAAWSPRLVFQYDYASGDKDPTDGKDNRFDTLYGARRFEFGVTGIHGAFARSNISSPGVRIEAKPSKVVTGFVGYRAVWLASDQDALTTGGVRDAAGEAGSFVGHQAEVRLRYDILPGNVRLEAGGAYLAHGHFLKTAPNAPQEGDSTYLYAQAGITF
jgi:hypothetical protein